MSTPPVWNDESRHELREALRSGILGELRLAKRRHADIVQACREVYMEDVCPENEWDSFIQFVVDELDRAATRLASEQSKWPEETDCDRLDRVEVALRERGILLWQVSPCCDTCTGGELPDRVDVIDRRCPGFRERIRGYGFFIDQNLPETLADATELSVFLAYGWFSRDEFESAPDVYERNALGIAREVCECLRNEGFEPDWDGDFARKIGVALNWQRRTVLE
ncbi:MAG TPA: hypothetical protein VFG04_18480 [Planctomycetaceae bacterium]|jgi:hypothetical protein|nr:hypothetical protein [Planctomycetaceae bacterium]